MKKKASEQGKGAPRRPEDYLGLSRSVAANHFRSELTKSSTRSPKFIISDFFSSRSFTWIFYYIQSRMGFKHPYTSHYDKTDNGVYQMSDNSPVSIAIAGDWATFTIQSIAIADRMRALKPHFTIHIGDTYYVGAPHEIKNNFTKKGAPWPHGSLGSFALLGNHEMYARGIAFYDELLPSMGLKSKGKSGKQKAPFFCLQNKYWRILGLDTGYHSIGSIPILEMVSWFTPICRFDQKMMDWLKETVGLGNPDDKRGLLILTHHQYISAFHNDAEYMTPATQLATLIGKDRPVVWLWGHEHKFSVYEKCQVDKGITAYGRCIGHGGMPIELKSKEFKPDKKKNGFDKLVMVDQRQDPKAGEQFALGYNGFALVNLKGKTLEIEYHDVNEKLFSELWEPTAEGGVKGTINPPNAINATQKLPGKSWDDAVK
jgi:Calcineurin-like phosphoesterase